LGSNGGAGGQADADTDVATEIEAGATREIRRRHLRHGCVHASDDWKRYKTARHASIVGVCRRVARHSPVECLRATQGWRQRYANRCFCSTRNTAATAGLIAGPACRPCFRAAGALRVGMGGAEETNSNHGSQQGPRSHDCAQRHKTAQNRTKRHTAAGSCLCCCAPRGHVCPAASFVRPALLRWGLSSRAPSQLAVVSGQPQSPAAVPCCPPTEMHAKQARRPLPRRGRTHSHYTP
jgi:hypothetical protein